MERKRQSSSRSEADPAENVTGKRTPALRRHREPCLAGLSSGGGRAPRPAGRTMMKGPQPGASLRPLLLRGGSLEHFLPYCGVQPTTPQAPEMEQDSSSFQREQEMRARTMAWVHEKVLRFCPLCDLIDPKQWPSVWV